MVDVQKDFTVVLHDGENYQVENKSIHEILLPKKLRILGIGRTGNVYDVMNKEGQHFALKVITKSKEYGDTEFKNERTIQEVLAEKCSFVLPLLGSFQKDNKFYFVFPIMAGELYEALYPWNGSGDRTEVRLNNPSKFLCFRYFLEVCKVAHDNNILIRDMKFENVLLGKTGEFFMNDFGSSNRLEGGKIQAHGGKIKGVSRDYIAPEVVLGKDYGKASDMWSLGIILYQLMLTHTPWQPAEELGSSVFAEEMRSGDNMKFDSQDDSDLRLQYPSQYALIKKLLEKDPKKRITIDQILCEAGEKQFGVMPAGKFNWCNKPGNFPEDWQKLTDSLKQSL